MEWLVRKVISPFVCATNFWQGRCRFPMNVLKHLYRILERAMVQLRTISPCLLVMRKIRPETVMLIVFASLAGELIWTPGTSLDTLIVGLRLLPNAAFIQKTGRHGIYFVVTFSIVATVAERGIEFRLYFKGRDFGKILCREEGTGTRKYSWMAWLLSLIRKRNGGSIVSWLMFLARLYIYRLGSDQPNVL